MGGAEARCAVNDRRWALGGGRPTALLEDEDDRWRTLGGGGGRPTVLRAEEVDDRLHRRCCVWRRSTTGDGHLEEDDWHVLVEDEDDRRRSWRRWHGWRTGRLVAHSWRRKTSGAACREGRRLVTSVALRAKEDGSMIFSGAQSESRWRWCGG
jgi:hypothetical protein